MFGVTQGNGVSLENVQQSVQQNIDKFSRAVFKQNQEAYMNTFGCSEAHQQTKIVELQRMQCPVCQYRSLNYQEGNTLSLEFRNALDE